MEKAVELALVLSRIGFQGSPSRKFFIHGISFKASSVNVRCVDSSNTLVSLRIVKTI